ncbi:MAG TPA: amidohydrolase family protein [Bryobacteraceae bacterium]|nr:amidohydrolase family protein [Bryobacteraceae bacterium]
MNRRTFLAACGGAATAAAAPAVPKGACDCHTHIFGDPARFPFSPERSYTPRPALPEQMLALHQRLGMDRVVIVTPSVYGTDNAATLWGMAELGHKRARGIAVIDERTTEAELDRMDKAGVRGIRLNLATAGIADPAEGRERFRRAAERMRRRGWHIQIYAAPAVVAGIRDLVMESPVPVVFDHFGGAKAALGVEQPGFAALLAMVESGKAYVKISGAYRASERGPDYPDAAPLARALTEANPDRILWGTDWPHPDSPGPAGRKATEVSAPLPVDDARLLGQLTAWAPDAGVRKKILTENPARLYGF